MIDHILFFLHLLVAAVISNPQGIFKATTTGSNPLWNDTQEDKLKKDLLMNYDRYVRPENYKNYTELGIILTVNHLETDEVRSVVIVESLLSVSWSDSKLKWNSSDYDGLKVIRIGDHEVWQPDIYLYNGVSDGEQLSGTSILVYNNGEVMWVPPIKLTAFCKFNLRHWPFDKQYCTLKFTSWTLTGSALKHHNNTFLKVEDTASTSAWHIEGSGEVLSDEYSYDKVVFHLNLTRKSAPYSAIVVTPAVVSTFLILAQFALPPQAEEKIILNVIIVTMLNFFLFYFNKQIYGSGQEIPSIVLFYSYSLYLAGISLVGSVVTYLVCTVEKLHPPSRSVKRALLRLQKFLFLTEDKKTNAWITIAACVDRILLLIYAFIFLVLAIVLA